MVTYRITLGPELDWLPDDTEESLLGSTAHQSAIVVLDNSLNSHKCRAGLSWFVTNKVPLIIPRQGGGTYQPAPDILVHPMLGDTNLDALSVATHGSPSLIMEVTSPATAYQHDLDTLNPHGKPLAYDQAGIPEYLVFDPTGDMIPDQIRAWHKGARDAYGPWLPDPATGRWHSALGISFAPQGLRLRVYDSDSRLIPTIEELADKLTALTAKPSALRAEYSALQAELCRLRGE